MGPVCLGAAPRAWPRVCLGDAQELEGRPASKFSSALPDDYLFRQQHRKWWEWEFIAECADKLGALQPDAVAVGLGTGFEPLMFHFANYCGQVTATDLYSLQTDWSEARFEDSESVRQIAPMNYPVDRLSIKNADMRTLPITDATVDLVWSTSSIEHVPSLVDEIAVFREIARVLKPGGIAVLTTEYCISEPPYLLPGVQAMDELLLRAIFDQADCFEVVGEWDLSYNWNHPGNGVHVRRFNPPYFSATLKIGGPRLAALKMGQMANAVGLSRIVPVAFVLRRRAGGALPDWDKLQIPAAYRAMGDGAQQFSQGENVAAAATFHRLWAESGNATLQLRLHAARFGLDAELRAGRHNAAVADVIRRFITDLPRHALQDADCTDLFSYILLASGDAATAADICREAALSPSTVAEQAIRLAVRYAVAQAKLGAMTEGARFVGDVIADLMVSGASGEATSSSLNKALEGEQASAPVVSAVGAEIAASLSGATSALSDECRAISGKPGLPRPDRSAAGGLPGDAEQLLPASGKRGPLLRRIIAESGRSLLQYRQMRYRPATNGGKTPRVMANGTDDPSPSLEYPVSQACTRRQFESSAYAAWCSAIREVPRHHRKQWEFCYILQALAVAGMLEPRRRGLGFGVGVEPLAAVLAARGCHLVATDLDSTAAQNAGWVDTNQHAAGLASLNERGICEPARFVQNVAFRVVNMNAIPDDLTDFDFAWSSCSLEHLGSITLGLAFIENSLRTLRPGGIAVHTTEFNCSSDTDTVESGDTVLFRRSDMLRLAERLWAKGHQAKFNFNLGDQPLDSHIDVAPYASDNHLKLQIGQYISTSFGLIIRKAS